MSDVLVIGAGAVGCLSAMALVKRGARVTLVDRGELGMESSWAGGGILFPLLPWQYSEAVNRLALAGAAFYPALAGELRTATGIDPEYTVSGMLIHPDFDIEAARQWCSVHGVIAELREGKLWLPQVGQARNPRLMRALRARLQGCGVRIVENTELAPLHADGERISTWNDTGGERYEADAFVLTAGAWSRGLLGEHAMDIRIKPMRGQMLLYRLAPGALENILYSEDFYLIPRRDGHILAGSTVEDVGFDKSSTPQAAADLHRKAIRLLPALADAPIVKHWSGLRPGSPENVPTIARHPSFCNLYLNAGHFRYGVTMAPASAEILADLMAGRPSALEVDYAFPA
jgi:glycine oxidase